ncbi:lipase [Apiospora marii]|uniref:lipase n=1 Tax=Apiospora marii TaxID=335849 RepID=UPI00312E4E0F
MAIICSTIVRPDGNRGFWPTTASPTSPEQVQSVVRDAPGTQPPDLNKAAAKHIDAGMGGRQPESFAWCDRPSTTAPIPATPLLLSPRRALCIPTGFTYGAKPPVIFIPGTERGSYGGGDRLRVRHLCAAGGNHNYLVAGRVGGPSQWALTFWPSTRARVPNLLAVAADFRGTTVVVLLCVSVAAGVAPGLLCDPAAKQQTYDSGVVSALRRHGGGSAWGAHDVALLGLPERDNAAAVGRRRLGVPR